VSFAREHIYIYVGRKENIKNNQCRRRRRRR